MKYEIWATFGNERKLVQTTGWHDAALLVADALRECGATDVKIVERYDAEREAIMHELRKLEAIMRELGKMTDELGASA